MVTSAMWALSSIVQDDGVTAIPVFAPNCTAPVFDDGDCTGTVSAAIDCSGTANAQNQC